MLKSACVLVLAIVGQGLGDCVIDGTTLVMVSLVHRHGDRTPTESSVSMSTDVEAVEAITAKYGYGQLTNVGKRRAYDLGKFLRCRYNQLLSPQYNTSEIYLRSTDSTRTKMTLLTALAAVYPAYPGSWSKQINWVPVPYTTVPFKYDYNLASLNCPTFVTAQTANSLSANSRMDPYSEVLADAAVVCNAANLTQYPALLAYLCYDVLQSQKSLGVPLGDEASSILPELKEAAGVAIDIIYGDKPKLNSGVWLNDFISHAENVIAGVDTPRVRVLSAHDVNVISSEAAAKATPRQGVPEYGSAFCLELRKDDTSGLYYVLPVYTPSPGDTPIYLTIEGCGDGLCTFDKFKEIVSGNLVDEDTWRSECGFTPDITFDASGFA